MWYCKALTASLGSPDVYQAVNVSCEKRGILMAKAKTLVEIIAPGNHTQDSPLTQNMKDYVLEGIDA